MTVTVEHNKTFATGNGSLQDFDFDFNVVAKEDVVLLIDSEIPKVYGIDYTVTLSTITPGGTVHTTTAPANGAMIVIKNISPITQEMRIPTEQGFREEKLEQAYDKLTLIDVQQQEQLDRTIKLSSFTQDFSDVSLPPVVPRRAIIFNENGDGFTTTEFDPDTAQTDASGFADDAEDAAVLAQAWAMQTPGPVSGGNYSAKQYAINANTSASQSSVSAAASAASAAAAAASAAALNLPVPSAGNAGKSLRIKSDYTGYEVYTPVFAKEFVSNAVAINTSAVNPFAHTLGVVPKTIRVTAVCRNADLGYTPGQEVEVHGSRDRDVGGSGTNDWQYAVVADNTTINVIVSHNGMLVPTLVGNFEWQPINGANWDLIVRAWA